jgi:hypothetical protein
MDRRHLEELARDPRFIPGIYNYCDRWCERCAFTSRCLNYAMSEEEERADAEARDAANKAFWDKLDEVFETAAEMIEEQSEEMDFELDEGEFEEYVRQDKEVHEAAESQPFSRLAMKYVDVVDQWFKLNEVLLGDKDAERKLLAQADIHGAEVSDSEMTIRDCLEVLRWYQPQIWVKLCRAAGGAIRADLEDAEAFQDDADGSAKVAIIGIERSIAAWATLLRRFPDHEDPILALAILKRLLRQVDAAFPNARAFQRPGFDTEEKPME